MKLKKYPKKPKAKASLAVKENFLKKCKEIDKDNRKKISDKAKSEKLTEKIKKVRRPSY